MGLAYGNILGSMVLVICHATDRSARETTARLWSAVWTRSKWQSIRAHVQCNAAGGGRGEGSRAGNRVRRVPSAKCRQAGTGNARFAAAVAQTEDVCGWASP